MSLIERARHISRPRSATTSSRKVASHPADENHDSQVALCTAKERVDAYLKGSQKSPRWGWGGNPYDNEPEVLEVGPTICRDFTLAVADFTLSVNQMKSIVDEELNKGIFAVREAVAQATTEISDVVGKTKTPNDVWPDIQAEMVRLQRETQLGLESRVLQEMRKANSDCRTEMQEIKKLLEQYVDAVAMQKGETPEASTPLRPVTSSRSLHGGHGGPSIEMEAAMEKISKMMSDMKEAILLQGYRSCMPLTHQVTALQESISAQNEKASAETSRVLQAVAKIDRYNVDLNPVLDVLNQGLAKLERSDAVPDVNPLLLDAIAKIDRTPVDLSPVLEAIAKLRRESNHAPVLAAIAQLDNSSSVKDSLDRMSVCLDFTPLLQKFDHVESRLNQIHVSTELVPSRIDELQHRFDPMLETFQKLFFNAWKSDLTKLNKSINGVCKNLDIAPLKASIGDLIAKNETLSSSLNVGMKRMQKQLTTLEEVAVQARDGEQLTPEMEAIGKLETTLEQMHEMQETMLGTLEKQEMSYQNRMLPVAELSVWQAGDFTTCTNNYAYRDALR
jgi:uncharacterized phage infection (PIP) family protein YhgE